MAKRPIAIDADSVPAHTGTDYPPPHAARVGDRARRALGEVFGLAQFGVNLTRLGPGARSALRHAHSHEDEFVYILQGTPTLLTDAGETALRPGMCAGFAAGDGNAHALVNRSDADVLYIEIGSRNEGDVVDYPDAGMTGRSIAGHWTYLHDDGTPFA